MADELNPEIEFNSLLKVIDVARILNISDALVYQMIAKGELTAVRIRKKLVRVYLPDLEEYIENCRTKN